MLAKLLEHRAGVDSRREIGVTKEEFLIGRGPDCDLRLAVPAVSRHHCLLRFRGGEATLTDLGSVNGTFVNGQRVRSQAVLHDGDEIRLGPCTFLVQFSVGPTPHAKIMRCIELFGTRVAPAVRAELARRAAPSAGSAGGESQAA